jgi:hypothetical protein
MGATICGYTPAGVARFGLVAEEVEKIMPDFPVYDEDQQLYGVRYDAVNAMSLYEVQKQHVLIAEQEKVLVEQRTLKWPPIIGQGGSLRIHPKRKNDPYVQEASSAQSRVEGPSWA